MIFSKFMEYGTHLDNFEETQLEEIFDFEEIEKLTDNEPNGNAILLLSQHLVGNNQQPLNELKKMDSDDRRRVLLTWVDLVKEPQSLKGIAISIIKLV